MGQQFRDLVLKTLATLIREREIVWICADTKYARRSFEMLSRRKRRGFVFRARDQKQAHTAHTKEAQIHKACLPSPCVAADRPLRPRTPTPQSHRADPIPPRQSLRPNRRHPTESLRTACHPVL